MQFTEIATGYAFLEAPRVQGDALWFCDLLAGGLFRLNSNGGIDKFLPDLTHIGGICLNHDGRLILSRPDGIGWFDPSSGKTGLIVDSIAGKPFPGGNDMFPDGMGGLYFGTVASSGGSYQPGASGTGLYRLTPDGTVTLQHADTNFANGCGLSPDGKTFYHTESLRGIFAYDVLPDGRVRVERELFRKRDRPPPPGWLDRRTCAGAPQSGGEPVFRRAGLARSLRRDRRRQRGRNHDGGRTTPARGERVPCAGGCAGLAGAGDAVCIALNLPLQEIPSS
jgi:sugar lactone lactonase YvrE